MIIFSYVFALPVPVRYRWGVARRLLTLLMALACAIGAPGAGDVADHVAHFFRSGHAPHTSDGSAVDQGDDGSELELSCCGGVGHSCPCHTTARALPPPEAPAAAGARVVSVLGVRVSRERGPEGVAFGLVRPPRAG